MCAVVVLDYNLKSVFGFCLFGDRKVYGAVVVTVTLCVPVLANSTMFVIVM